MLIYYNGLFCYYNSVGDYMKKREINTIFASISALLLVFGLIYGLFFFNIGKNKKANSDMGDRFENKN